MTPRLIATTCLLCCIEFTAKTKEQKSTEEARKAAEKERSARQAAQAKALEQLQAENEAAAIAAVSIFLV